jgi:hypothetical protein
VSVRPAASRSRGHETRVEADVDTKTGLVVRLRETKTIKVEESGKVETITTGTTIDRIP